MQICFLIINGGMSVYEYSVHRNIHQRSFTLSWAALQRLCLAFKSASCRSSAAFSKNTSYTVPQRGRGMSATQRALVCCTWQREYVEVAYERRMSAFAPSQLERSRGEDKRMRGKERWRLIAWLARLRLLSVFMPHLISDSEWPSCPVMQGPLELNWTLDPAEKSTWRW